MIQNLKEKMFGSPSKVSPLSRATNLYEKVVSNAAYSSQERNAKQFSRSVDLFNNRQFSECIQSIKEQPTKNFLSNILSIRCLYHQEELKAALKMLRLVLHECAARENRTLEDVENTIHTTLNFCQLILFKIVPKRMALTCLLPEEDEASECSEKDCVAMYINQVGEILELLRTKHLSVLPPENYLGNDIRFLQAMVNYRFYEYESSQKHLDECLKKLTKLHNDKYHNFDYVYTHAFVYYLKKDYEKALYFASKAERSVSVLNSFQMSDSCITSDMGGLVSDLLTKIKLAEYLDLRMVKRAKNLGKNLEELSEINLKRKQNDPSFQNTFDKREELYSLLAKKTFRDFDLEILDHLRLMGQYQFVLILAQKLLEINPKEMKYVYFIMESYFSTKQFVSCLSTFSKYESALIESGNEKRMVQIHMFALESFVTVFRETGTQSITPKKAFELLKYNISHTSDQSKIRQLNLASKIYSVLGLSEKYEQSIKIVRQAIKKQPSSIILEDHFWEKAFTDLERKFELIKDVEKPRTPKSTPKKQDDITIYSSFEDFSPLRLAKEQQKKHSALEDLKRKREQQSPFTPKKTKH